MGALKIFRPLSILLCFIVLISSFSVTVYGADEENLISHNFNDWSKLPQYEQYTTLYGNSNVNGIQALMCGVSSEINDKKIAVGGLYDISDEYVVGDNYELSFEFLSSDKYVATALGTIGSDRAFHDYSSILIVGVGSFNNNEVTVDEEYSIIINSDNYNDYINGTLKLSFEMPSGLINPCVAVSFLCVNADADQVNNVYLTFRNFQLINKSAQKEDNFFSRLFEWFEVKFKAIGDSFSDLGVKLGELKSSFTESISNLGNSIGGFFTKLGNLILYASWSEVPPENPFVTEDKPLSSLAIRLKAISDSFASSGESFENVIDSITGPVYLLDEFTKEFGWILGILIFTLAVIVISRFIGL